MAAEETPKLPVARRAPQTKEQRDALMKEIGRMYRVPFRRVLADLIGAAPTPERLVEFADKSPNLWAQTVAIFAQLGGYEKGINLNVNVVNVQEKSDADLLAMVNGQVQELKKVAGNVIDVEAVQVEATTSTVEDEKE